MAQVINTNILSLNAQRNLNNTSGALQTSLQRLSSGLRINSAKDDAAGLAISERFTTQIRGLNQAIRNANDGISLAQTGEAALAEVTQNMQRIRELAVQSVNATNSDKDRATLQQEVSQRLDEIERIASQTSFNGRKVLDGTFGSAQFQVGANVGETIALGLSTSMRTSDVGSVATATSNAVAGAGNLIVLAADPVATTSRLSGSFDTVTLGTGTVDYDFTVGGHEVYATTTADAVINAGTIDTALEDTDVLAALGGDGITFTGTAAAGNLQFFKANGTDMVIEQTVELGTGTANSGGDGFATYAAGPPETGFIGTYDNGTTAVAGDPLTIAAGDLQFTVGTGNTISVSGTFATGQALVDKINEVAAGNATASIADNVISLTAGEDITIDVDESQVFSAGSFAAAGDLAGIVVTSEANANVAIQRVDSALSSVSDLRSTFGAIQNRFESTISNLSTTAENLTAARSRILDADFAQETANLTRAQILQQAGISVLAQANAAPQSVLSLLQ